MSERARGAAQIERLEGLRTPDPPHGLRSRTLAAATSASTSEAEADIWTRLWTSRPLRLAWATAVVALVVVHLAVTPRPKLVGAGRIPVALTANQPGGELAEITRLPRIEPSALARLP